MFPIVVKLQYNSFSLIRSQEKLKTKMVIYNSQHHGDSTYRQ